MSRACGAAETGLFAVTSNSRQRSLRDRLAETAAPNGPPALRVRSLLDDLPKVDGLAQTSDAAPIQASDAERPSLKARLQALIEQQVGNRRERSSEFDTGPSGESTPGNASDFNATARLTEELNERLHGLGRVSSLPGEVIDTPHGAYHRRDEVYRLSARVGRVTLDGLVTAPTEAARKLTANTTLDGFDAHRTAFIDTETTGLSGGAGTAAFLVAIGFLRRDETDGSTAFVVRQYLMRDFHEERAVIRAVERDLEAFDTIVSFNGKQFDVPLLESRFRMQRRRFPQIDRHLDLLHPARRLWKARLESCSLQSLERGVLGLYREDDVGGELVPARYFEYVRRRDASLLSGVLEHNLQDVVSLAALTAEALKLVTDVGAFPDDAHDLLSLGKVLERAEDDERSEEMFRAIAETGSGQTRIDAVMRLGLRAKARKDWDEAERRWREAVALGHFEAYRELAIVLEHRRKDSAAALAVVDEALDLIAGDFAHVRLEDDLLKRRARLSRKA